MDTPESLSTLAADFNTWRKQKKQISTRCLIACVIGQFRYSMAIKLAKSPLRCALPRFSLPSGVWHSYSTTRLFC